MEVKPVVAVVTQKLTDTLNDESVADNKVMMHQLKGVQKSLGKLQSFSKEDDVCDASQRTKDHLHVVYQIEDEVEKFTFTVARQRKIFGFLMKHTFFFNNLNSCSRLKRKIKKIQLSISGSAEDVITPSSASRGNRWEQRNSPTSSSDEEDCNDDDDGGFYDETHVLTQKSSSSVWPISEIPSTPSPTRGVLTRSFTMIPHLQENVQQRKKLTFSYSYNEEEMDIVGFREERLQHPKQMSNFSYQEEDLGLFGLNDDIKSLVNRLTEKSVCRLNYDFKNPVKQRRGMFIPIVGEVGSGKTTLARAVYRNRKIKDHFEFHDWISVMEEYTAERILLSMSKKVITEKDNGPMSPKDQELKSRVFNHLKGKRYLIVLDGVGNSGLVENLKDAFPDENNGSKVLFTSREVRRCPGQHIMDQLSEEKSWNMFLKEAGKEKKADKIELRLKYRILEICRGLPLNIVLVGALLSTKRVTRWSSAISRGNCSDEVLSLCYNDLTTHLKLCLLYLTLFPKDYDIPVRRLLRLWLAEGFVMRRSQQPFPEDLVQKYFEELVQRSMIQITKLRSDNSPRHCRLVSVLHDYLLPRAQDISLFYIHRNLEHSEDAASPFGVRRMVQHMSTTGALTTNTRGRAIISSASSLSCGCLSCREDTPTDMATSHSIPPDLQQSQVQNSTFDPSLVRSYVSFNFQRKDMPAREVGMFLGRIINSDFRLLRVLDLEGVNKPTLPDKLGHLRLLRYLGLRRTYLESLPESVGDLSYLETLDVKHTRVDSLPDSIWKLKQLRHLNLNNIRLAMPPSSSLTLLTLWGLVLDEKIKPNEGLGKLLDLRELGIKFNLSTSQGVLLDWVAKLENLQSLRLTSVDEMGRPSKLVLKPLVNLDKLSHLNLYGHLQRLPYPKEFPPTVKVLTLSISQLSMDPMETLEQLPCLIVLRLLAKSFTAERMACHRGGFKKLRVLKLWMLMELEEWDVEEEAMESLKELDIRCCHKLNNIPCRLLQKQKCLEELILTDMPDEFVAQTKRKKSKDTSLTINPWKFAP
ncbi:putative disease resistance RPP13-like protein 2 [Cynara cardunculus var. scolymus]|uniref:putative disease resistance RPP13-like protein 2 n=1 Tax=Cynara cardunculus var. scolymus TaxID=59895 RepID=UPI000D62A0D7|nr:putative disease resistance RPP13-like protein 2 [Cynara cardunculus var. scolymus]